MILEFSYFHDIFLLFLGNNNSYCVIFSCWISLRADKACFLFLLAAFVNSTLNALVFVAKLKVVHSVEVQSKRVHVKRCNLMLNFWSAMTAPIACSGQAAQPESGGKVLGVENSGCHILAT